MNLSKVFRNVILHGLYQIHLSREKIKKNLLQKFIILSKKRNLFLFGLIILLIPSMQIFFAKKFLMECIFKEIIMEIKLFMEMIKHAKENLTLTML